MPKNPVVKLTEWIQDLGVCAPDAQHLFGLTLIDGIKPMRIVLFLIIISFSNVYGTFDAQLKKLKISKNNNIVHIFLGIASNTCQLELMQFLKLDKIVPKIVAFNLFPNMKDTIPPSEYNVAFASVELKNKYWKQTPLNDLKNIIDFINSNDVQVVLYSNIWYVFTILFHVLNKIPHNKVKLIHMFEDGNCNTFCDPNQHFNTLKSQYYQFIVNKTYENQLDFNKLHPRNNSLSFYLNKKYKVMYHLAKANRIKQTAIFKKFRKKFGQLNICNVDFKKRFNQLTPENQEKFLKITVKDINIIKSYYKASSCEKILILIGYNKFGKLETYDNACLNMIKEIREGRLNHHLKKGVKYQWFFKQHPTMHGIQDLAPKILQRYSDMIEIPAYIPFEAMVLAGFVPDHTCGMLSAAFFMLNKKNVLFGVKRTNEIITTALIELDILNKDNLYSLEEFYEQKDRVLSDK